MFVFYRWNSETKSIFKESRSLTLKINENEKMNRLPASGKKNQTKKIKASAPTKPISIYLNEQRAQRRRIPTSARRVERVYPGLAMGDSGKYNILNNFFAVLDTEDNRKLYPDAIHKLNYLIVEGDLPPVDSLKVSQNTDNGTVGIITGVLKVKLKDISMMNQIFEHNNYSIDQSYEHINLVHYKFTSIDQALKSYEELKTNPNVSRVNIEVLEYSRHQR